MALNGSPQYASANNFRTALEHRLKAEAKTRGRNLEELRREFLFQRFLALVFSGGSDQWVLKGGASLLMRLADARFSKDLDLLRLGEQSVEDAITELRTLTAPSTDDHLTFVIEDGVALSTVNPVASIKVTAYIGAKYGSFPIDLARELHFLATPERIRPEPVVDVPGLGAMPDIVVYPLTDQVADKVCAMYEVHGETQNPSTRYRDLADLVLIVTTSRLDAALSARALASEARRRGLALPDHLVTPAPSWAVGYPALARRTRLPASMHDLDAALAQVAQCVDPLLSGRETGTWVPNEGWVD